MSKGILIPDAFRAMYSTLEEIKSELEKNFDQMRDEPPSDGVTHDSWEEEHDAMEELIDGMDELLSNVD